MYFGAVVKNDREKLFSNRSLGTVFMLQRFGPFRLTDTLEINDPLKYHARLRR